MEDTGTATRTMMLDGRVLVEEVNSSMMGTPFTGHAMTGYDNVSGKYWSTWNDNMSTGVMVSEGTCDAQRACSFAGSWNDPIKKGPVTARMTSRWTSPTTGVTYETRWRVHLPGPGVDLDVRAVLPNQELDTRPTTGVVYWEGAVRALGTSGGRPVGGRGYVELAGRQPSVR